MLLYIRSILNITNKPYQFPFIVRFTSIAFFKPMPCTGRNILRFDSKDTTFEFGHFMIIAFLVTFLANYMNIIQET